MEVSSFVPHTVRGHLKCISAARSTAPRCFVALYLATFIRYSGAVQDCHLLTDSVRSSEFRLRRCQGFAYLAICGRGAIKSSQSQKECLGLAHRPNGE